MGRGTRTWRGGTVEQWGKVFGAQVRLRRVQMGLYTQQALAQQMGYATHGSISQIEMGNVAANFDVACQLALFLGISLDAILGLTPAPAPPATPEWYADMLMVRLPSHVHALWAPGTQQEILTRLVEAMGRAMRETMPPAQTAPSAAEPAPDQGPGVRPIRPTGTIES